MSQINKKTQIQHNTTKLVNTVSKIGAIWYIISNNNKYNFYKIVYYLTNVSIKNCDYQNKFLSHNV